MKLAILFTLLNWAFFSYFAFSTEDPELPKIAKLRAVCVSFLSKSRSEVKLNPKQFDEIHKTFTDLVPEKYRYSGSLFRGFGMSNFGPKEMIRNLFGDWRHMIASRDVTEALAKNLKSEPDYEKALHQSLNEVAAQIRRDIKVLGAGEYARKQSIGSHIARNETAKYSSSLSFSTSNPIKPSLSPKVEGPTDATWFTNPGLDNSPSIIVEMHSEASSGVRVDGESQVFLYVPPALIKRFLVAYGKVYIAPAGEPALDHDGRRWYCFDILERDSSEKPTHITIRKARLGKEYIKEGNKIIDWEKKFYMDEMVWDSKNPTQLYVEVPELQSAIQEATLLLGKSITSTDGPIGKLKISNREAGGNTGGRWYQDEQNTFWFIKKDIHYPELQTSAEVISSQIYKHFGYKAPQTTKILINKIHYSASREIENLMPLSNYNTSEFRQMRIIAAYLKDWDRLQNLVADSTGDLVIIDFGGTLGSRARGEFKPGKVFSKAIGAFESTKDTSVIYDGFIVNAPSEHPWQQITRKDALSVIEKFKILKDDKIREIVESAGYSNFSDTEYMISALKQRRDGIISSLLNRFTY